MTATPIRKLLEAKPSVSFKLCFGFENETEIDDPELCWLDDEDLVLYVRRPAVEVPKAFVKSAGLGFPATVEIVDLRLVQRVVVQAERMPG